MADQLDYSILDDPSLIQFVFFPRQDWTPSPAGVVDHFVPVWEDLSISCRFYPIGQHSPSILYFHGNGEVASDYDWIAPLYNQIGINLFVADYRGYGRSNGTPAFSSAASDAHLILDYFEEMLLSGGYTSNKFVMGRSLGSQSAIELAANYPERMSGLILESGFTQNRRLLGQIGLPLVIPGMEEFEKKNLELLSTITMPALLIHGERDTLISPDESEVIYNHIGTDQKRLVIVPNAGHNDIMLVGKDVYFESIKRFIFKGG
ncbi:MAG: alpha/beta fold hydrolase [Dehalococcoidia bacterium]